jgi:hypothetical protein
VRPPDEYVRALEARGEADRELARAERVWRWSRWTAARPVTILLRTAILLWGLVVLGAAAVCFDRDWPPRLVTFLAILLVIVQTMIGFAGASILDEDRKALPPVPHRSELHAGAETTTCRSCGGPIGFDAGRFAAACAYCGSDNYRASLAVAASALADRDRDVAYGSLLDAVRSIQERRSNVLGYIMLVAVSEVFYAVFLGIVAIVDALGG